MDPHMAKRRSDFNEVHHSAASCDRAEMRQLSAGAGLQCNGSSRDDAGDTASHSSDTAAPLLGPEGSSGSSGSPAAPADVLAPAAPEESTGAEAACSQGSAAPEVSVLDDDGAAAGQEGGSSGSGDASGEAGANGASQDFPVAGFSRKDTPYVCQVPGCERDLAREKPYYRRYRVCRPHAAAKEVGVPGNKRRYCQQCSIFHTVAEFDDEKRTCRARLQWHNSKRRKRTEAIGATTVTTRPTTALQRKATRRSSSALGVTELMGPAAGIAFTAAEVKAEAPAAGQPPRAAVGMAQRSVQRRSLGEGAAGHPGARSLTGLLPFGFAPKGRRSTAAPLSAAARVPEASVPPPGPLPASAPSLPAAAAQASPPAAVNWRQGSVLPLLPPLSSSLQLLPQDVLGTLLLAPEPPSSTAAGQPRGCRFGGLTPSVVGPLPPPGHAWSVLPPLPPPPPQPPATARQHMDTPPPQQQQQQQQQAACQQQPEQQPPSTRSSSDAADWHAELLQMPLDWDWRLPEDAPGAAGLPMPPLRGGAALPTTSPQGGRAAGAAAAHAPAVLQLSGAPDPLDEALPPPPPPLDVDRQLVAAAAQFPAVAAAAAAAWGLQWPPPPVQQLGGSLAQALSPQEPSAQQQCSPLQRSLPEASASIERLGSSHAPLHEWGAVPVSIDPALPDLAWSLAVPLRGGHAMEVDPPQALITGAACAGQEVHGDDTCAGEARMTMAAQQLRTAHPTLQQQKPAQLHMQQSASDASTHCGHSVVQMQMITAAAAADDMWDELLPEDIDLC